MLEGKSEKLGFQEMLSSPYWKVEMSKRKTKRIGESKKKIWKKRWIKRQWKNDLWSDHPEIQFGPIIFSFETMNPGLYYVPEKSILIKRGYSDWRVFLLEKSFLINKAVVSFPQPTKNLDQSFTCSGWILNCQVHNRIVTKENEKRMKIERKMTLGWKPERAA